MNTETEYAIVQKTNWDEDDFKTWCEENGNDFDEWLVNVICVILKKGGLYKVETLKDFEKVAETIYHTYS
jgi:hypothetical protein